MHIYGHLAGPSYAFAPASRTRWLTVYTQGDFSVSKDMLNRIRADFKNPFGNATLPRLKVVVTNQVKNYATELGPEPPAVMTAFSQDPAQAVQRLNEVPEGTFYFAPNYGDYIAWIFVDANRPDRIRWNFAKIIDVHTRIWRKGYVIAPAVRR